MSRLDDPELMELVQLGSCEAFEVLYRRHLDAAMALARKICDADLAQDVSQAAFLSVWTSRARFRSERGNAAQWIMGIVRNTAMHARRNSLLHKRRLSSLDGVEDLKAAPERTEDQATQRQAINTMQEALATLPKDQRLVLQLAYFRGLTHEQIARALQVPLGTAKGRLRLGQVKLRHYLVAGGGAKRSHEL
jgi:RNA polymerase sigma-70 factor, ECF subfamily